MKRKVVTIVGTRPELIKMSLVIKQLDRHCDHVLVHTGQNYDYELNQIFFDDLRIRKPDHFLNAAGGSVAETIARVITGADAVFEAVRPDALMIYGDTNSGLAVIPAKRRKIPVFHMEAGNRCFDQRVPEELNRKIIDHLSDVNMVLAEHARRYLIAEGLPADRIFNVGSHMREVLDTYRPSIEASRVLDTLNLVPDGYFVVSAHREENVDSPAKIKKLLESLNLIAGTYGKPIIFSAHPRTRLRLQEIGDGALGALSSRVQVMPPFGFTDYIRLQLDARCVLSDSGTITEEASLLGFAAITMRDAHERPEGMDAGTLVRTGVDPEEMLNAIRVVCDTRISERHAGRVPDYEVNDVSTKVLRIVLSYIDVVNRTVWSKTSSES